MISVIMATYNAERTLPDAIESILSQTFENFEFLIMNDGSTDSTQKILNNYAMADKRIKLFENKKNVGLTVSLRHLAGESSYEILARQDSDDRSHKKRFEKQYNILTTTNFSICTTRSQSMQTLKKVPKFSYFLPKKIILKYKNPFIHGTLMIKKQAYLDVGGYDIDYKYAQDYKLILDLYDAGKKIKTLNEILYYLNTKDNISTLNADEQKYYFNLARKNRN